MNRHSQTSPGGVDCRRYQQTKDWYSNEHPTKRKTLDGPAGSNERFLAFYDVTVADGANPLEFKELTANAMPLTTQCPYCLHTHSGSARKTGTTDAEMVEAAKRWRRLSCRHHRQAASRESRPSPAVC